MDSHSGDKNTLKDELNKARRSAFALLARREHSAHELMKKLQRRDFSADAINETLAYLREIDLQSDTRFAEAYFNKRVNDGYGPLRIEPELRERGIADHLIDVYVNASALDWLQLARKLKQKKYGVANPEEYSEKAKQMRFLQYRGFTVEHIQAVYA